MVIGPVAIFENGGVDGRAVVVDAESAVGHVLPGPPAGVIVVVMLSWTQVQIPSPSSKLGLLQSSPAAGVGAGVAELTSVVAGGGVPLGRRPVSAVGQVLPGPPAGVIVVVTVPCIQVHIPSPSSKLGLLH